VNGQRTIHGRENESSALTLALEFTRRGAEAVSRSGGIHASTPFSAQLEALRRAAEANGWLKTFDWLPESPDARGFEHEVWFLGVLESLVTKATYENSFGVRADGGMALPVEYFERLLLQNEVFGDDSNLMVYGKFAHISTG
jgi:hypothetical protein